MSGQLEEIMEERRTVAYGREDVRRPMALEGIDRPIGVAAPILASGDVSGAVVLLGDGQTGPSDSDVKLAQVAAAFLGRQMEG